MRNIYEWFKDILLIGKNESLTREQALSTNVEVIFERVMTELVQKMREMNVSRHFANPYFKSHLFYIIQFLSSPKNIK